MTVRYEQLGDYSDWVAYTPDPGLAPPDPARSGTAPASVLHNGRVQLTL